MRRKRAGHILIKLVAALLIICAALLLLGKYGLSVTRYTLSSDRLPDSFEGFRIVQLSDLHGSEFGADNKRLVRAVADESPDIIVMTGDFIGKNQNYLPGLKILVDQLVTIAPVYFVSGNHDWASGEIEDLADMLANAGVTYLKNEYLPLTRGADMIRPDELVDIINKDFPDSFVVLLGHRNYWITKYPELKVDIIFCGHSHGGIIRIPGVGGLLGTSGELLPRYDAGLFESGRYVMIVSRGLGNSISVPRFANTPEIVTLTLNKTQS